LEVTGTSTLQKSVFLEEGDLIIRKLADSTLSEGAILLVKPDGTVKSGGDLKSLIYAGQLSAQLPCASDMNGGYIQTAPYWQASANPQQMYLVNTNCSPDPRLGVGAKPEAKLHVRLEPDSKFPPLLIDKRVSNNPGVPAQKLLQLHENGTLLSRKVRVDMQNWADFVFSAPYPLMNLDSLEQFISQNRHLPGIPAEGEVLTEGIDLGEMNRLLLQKVEELTLYLLLEKRNNEELESRLRKIEEQLLNK
jgi:hypothetical protein